MRSHCALAYSNPGNQDNCCTGHQSYYSGLAGEQNNQSAPNLTPHHIQNMALTFELLKIKMLASSCTSKLQVIEQIKGGWDTEEDDEFAISRLEIELEIEYAVQVFQEIVTMVEQLLSDPPAYNDNPEEQHQRQMELQVLGSSAHDYVVALKDKLASLRDSVNDAMGTRVQEAFVRAKKVHSEAHEIVDMAKKLRKHEVTQ